MFHRDKRLDGETSKALQLLAGVIKSRRLTAACVRPPSRQPNDVHRDHNDGRWLQAWQDCMYLSLIDFSELISD
jgi:hypothetical protein